MRLVVFITGILFLGMIMIPLRAFSTASETYISGIAGIEDWMPLIFTLAPIIIPAGCAVVLLMYVIKGKSRNRE